ncbi:diaminopimelate decarboxylase [Clostridium paraputrificum]|uniref:diaminopimelate decarboxylase n=1 Tax=Clostridium TaxID=1485 RepID=UPI003D331EFB
MKLFGSMTVDSNELIIGGVKASNLAAEYGTPLYVMDEELLRNTCKDYYNYFKCSEENNRVAFAGKAFLNVEMVKLIKEEGLCLDVVSGGELYTAYKAGLPMEKVYFHGNNKTLDEIEFGVKLGVGRFVVDNLYEMENLDRIANNMGKVQDIYLRITPGIEAHTHDYIKTGQIDSKFGFAPVGDIIMEAVKMAISLKNINLAGLHCHIGSQIFELEPYRDAVEVMLTLINNIKKETGHLIKELDLGGGFGIYYTEADSPRTTKEYCETILNKVDEVCKNLNVERPILTIEPGRSIVGNAGLTLYRVGSVKEIPGVREYVAVDGGMVDNIRPALYQAKYECGIVNKMGQPNTNKVTIAGKCCESGDILITDTMLPKAETGDLLAIMSTGAYGFSMASSYNKIQKPAVVMVKEGTSRLAVKRESYEDLIRNELV